MNIFIYLVLIFPLEEFPSSSFLVHVIPTEFISILTPCPICNSNLSKDMIHTCTGHSILQAKITGSGHITQARPKGLDPRTFGEALTLVEAFIKRGIPYLTTWGGNTN